MTSRVWFITGASTGFGFAMVRCALAHGDRVVATLRKPSVLDTLAAEHPTSQLLITRVDVTKLEEFRAAFALALETFGRIDVVFNNAGYVVAGEAEATPDADARAVFEVDFWGAVQVSQEAVRVFRDVNEPRGGHLIQNSAAAGLIGVPTLSFYSAAKHALEGWSETLRKEVTCIEPCAFMTDIVGAIQITYQHVADSNPTTTTSAVRRSFAKGAFDGGSDPVKWMEKAYELSMLEKPPLHLPLGLDAVNFLRGYIADLKEEVESYASWSDNLAAVKQ